MAHTIKTAFVMNETGDGLVEIDLRELSADQLLALRNDAAKVGDLDLVASIDQITEAHTTTTWDLHDYSTGEYVRPATAAEWLASSTASNDAGVIDVDGRACYVIGDSVVDLVERYRVAIIDGDMDVDEIEAMDSDEGLAVELNGQPIVLWLRRTYPFSSAIVAWLGNDLDPDQHHLVEAELDVTDGWRRLNSSTPSGVANELAQLAGDCEDDEGDWIADELIERGLLRRRGSAAEIVEIRRMTEDSFDRVVATALGS